MEKKKKCVKILFSSKNHDWLPVRPKTYNKKKKLCAFVFQYILIQTYLHARDPGPRTPYPLFHPWISMNKQGTPHPSMRMLEVTGGGILLPALCEGGKFTGSGEKVPRGRGGWVVVGVGQNKYWKKGWRKGGHEWNAWAVFNMLKKKRRDVCR